MKQALQNNLNRSELAPLLKAVAAARRLDGLWQQLLPPNLRQQSQVIALENGVLKISSESPAIISKLKQMEQRLLAGLRQSGAEISAIRYLVQVANHFTPRQKINKNPQLSDKALNSIADTAASMQPSPLRDALQAMVNKRRTGTPG